jgi:hypothetical protein
MKQEKLAVFKILIALFLLPLFTTFTLFIASTASASCRHEIPKGVKIHEILILLEYFK